MPYPGLPKEWQDVLWFFQLRQARVDTTGTTFSLGAAVPMHVGVNDADDGIAPGFFQSLFCF